MADFADNADDVALREMFGSVPLADDGFSARVVARIQRRLWLRRLLLPAAAIGGGLVAAKPAAALLMLAREGMLNAGSTLVPGLQSGVGLLTAMLPGALVLAALLATLRLLED